MKIAYNLRAISTLNWRTGLSAAQAVGLLSTEVVLTGIRPEAAQTLVGLEVDLQTIKTRSRLQDGIASVLTAR